MASQFPLPIKFEIPKIPTEVVSKINEKETLEKYSLHSNKENVSVSLPYIDACIVDLKLLTESEKELQKFGSFLSSLGYIQIVNHGIEDIKIDQIRQLCKDFFNLPLEKKQKYARIPGRIEGWGGDTMSEGQSFNWNDRLLLRVFPVDQRSPMFWPNQSLPKFSEILEEYASEMSKVREVLFKAISKYLNLADDNLLNTYAKEGVMLSRFNYYPPCEHPDQVVGLRAHSDVHLLTVLLQDKVVEGLQIENNGHWFKVPIVPDALVVNVADMLEILSNGRIKSVFHRAVVNDTRARTSIAIGFGPPRNSEVGPLKELITEETPQLYNSDKNYVNTAAENYALGNRAIDTLKISKSSAI